MGTCIRAVPDSNPEMVGTRIRAIREETSARLVREKYQPDVPVAGLLVGGVGATSGLRLRMCRARVRYVRLSHN